MSARIFYFNITYNCNNRCLYCCSSNTVIRNKNQIYISDFDVVDSVFHIKRDDQIVISGGEPTLHDNFEDIVDYCYNKTPNIVVYTNGRLLHKLSDETIKKVNRFIIPIYGEEKIHDHYARSRNAFCETMRGIIRIMTVDFYTADVKLIIGDVNSTKKLLGSHYWREVLENRVFSITRLLKRENNPNSNIINLAEYIINSLSSGRQIRFYDLPICLFSSMFQIKLLARYKGDVNYDHNVICGSTNGRYRVYKFDSCSDYYSKCSGCQFGVLCVRIMKNYFCPMIYNDEVLLATE